MDYWAKPPVVREQMVLFAERLDEVVAIEHPVRLVDDILSRLDWSKWEAKYDLTRGQPPIHPRVLAGVILYGLLTRIRSSRMLEEALTVRLDFRWLAEGRSIDHTTLSEFRRKHPDELKQVFIQIGLVAREAALLSLEQLAFDGTRIRANSRRRGTRTPDELRQLREELAAKFTELEARLALHDTTDEERLVGGLTPEVPTSDLLVELADVRRRRQQIDAALAELERATQAGEPLPKRLPLTDPESRVMPNKEGGFAPNYTPMATVDTHSGLIAACDVIAQPNEEPYLLSQLEAVRDDFAQPTLCPEVLADGLMSTGSTLLVLHEHNVTLYSPSKLADPTTNPARRADPTQPVPVEQWDKLPVITIKKVGDQKITQLSKDAFIYIETEDSYRCPNGAQLAFKRSSTDELATRTATTWRYLSDAHVCATCPLRDRCLKPGQSRRELTRTDTDHLQEAHAERMSTPAAQEKYKKRSHHGERPFAFIKSHFGARQFLLRSLTKVRTEWRWLCTAYNLKRLLTLLHPRPGPLTLTTNLPPP